MSASSGAELDTVVKAEVAMIPPMTMPTPSRALSSGIPAASSEPNVMNSTTPANTTPNTSVMVIGTEVSWKTCPPNSTCTPAASPMAAVALRSAMVLSVTSVEGPSNWILMIAIDLSSLIALPAYWSNGPTTESTPGTFSIALTSLSIVAFSSSTDAPSGATTTPVALAPATEGNTASSRSSAACDSVPGIANESCVCPPRAMPPPSVAMRSRTQTPITRHEWRNEKRPRR